jgi:hypothetical protein
MRRTLRKRRAWDNLEALVLEGLATPARAMTKADWQKLRARVVNKTCDPRLSTLRRFAKAMGVDVKDLL